MKCPNCNFENPDSAKFCCNCGGKLEIAREIKCPNCGFKNPLDSLFCTECGCKLNSIDTTLAKNPQSKPIQELDTINNKQGFCTPNKEDDSKKEIKSQLIEEERIRKEALFISTTYELGYAHFLEMNYLPKDLNLMKIKNCKKVIEAKQTIIDYDKKNKMEIVIEKRLNKLGYIVLDKWCLHLFNDITQENYWLTYSEKRGYIKRKH